MGNREIKVGTYLASREGKRYKVVEISVRYDAYWDRVQAYLVLEDVDGERYPDIGANALFEQLGSDELHIGHGWGELPAYGPSEGGR